MAAKLLHSLADDSPDLKKQIGCMTGIFQIFDRQHTLTGRRFIHKRLPPGDSHCSNGSSEVEPVNEYSRHTAADVNLSKFEKQRLSTESSRASFSSSCSSSLSSMDCNRAATQEASSFDRIIFSDNPSKDVVISQSSTPPCLGRQSLDLREVVKDSMYREARGLSLKTAGKEEAMHQGAKPKDSPRPFHFPSSLGGPNGVRTGKQNTSDDLTLKESLHVLAKQQEAPRYYRETREHQRSSYESKDAPRFSYDGREMNRLSFESQDTLKSTLKLPRLSLDSILISVGNSNPSYCFPVRDLQNCGSSNEEGYDPEQSLGSQKRPPSVVARLMGLDSLPESASTNHSHLNNISPAQLSHSSLRPLKTYNLSMPVRIPKSPRSFMKDPISPRLKNPDLVMKPISRLPIEPAPWKQMDSSRGSYKPEFKAPKAPAKPPPSFPSLYTDIEKRLKDLEFKQSGKDRRALKQILEAMQAKGLLQTGKEEQGLKIKKPRDTESKHTSPNHKAHLSGRRSQRSNIVGASTSRGSDFVKTCESPIVIMKPSKLIEKSGSTSSVIPIDELSGLDKVPTGGHADNRKGSISSHNTGERDLRISQRDTSINSSDKKVGVRNVKQSSTRPQLSRDSTVKSRGSVSSRLQLMKIEMEKRSRPPTPPPDPNSTRKLSNRQPTESGSPGRKHRVKSTKVPSSDDQLSQISNESRTSSHQGDDVSLQSENMTIFDLKSDTEITSIEQSNLVNEGQSPFLKAACCLVSDSMERPVSTSEEDGMSAEPAMVAPEHPSPVSVLDVSVYRDDAPSPVKQIPDMPTVDSAIDFRGQKSEDTWTPTDKFLSDSMVSGLSSEINRKKLQNIENLVEKLRRLNSTHDEASTDYIASLCENKNPDHRYISEILLASGLLLRDLGSGLTTFQVHPSGHPINPELFLVLEQTKSSSLVWKEEYSPRESMNSKNLEKSQRQLIFDVVNEILLKKLALLEPSLESWLKSYKLARKTLSAQKLLKELCSEIEQLQVKKWECSSEEEEDGLKGILWEDEVQRWEGWTDFNAEVSGLVLDVERLIFKDLVDEIVRGEAARARPKQQARRRQLFANAT